MPTRRRLPASQFDLSMSLTLASMEKTPGEGASGPSLDHGLSEQQPPGGPGIAAMGAKRTRLQDAASRSLLSLFQDKAKINDNDIELSYDPRCGMSKEEHEWHCDQTEKIHQRGPEALHKLHAESEKVRHHFRDDPVALEIWDEYIDHIHLAASRNLTYSLSSYAQKCALYEKLMLSKARPITCAHMLSGRYNVGILSKGYEKLKRTTNNKLLVLLPGLFYGRIVTSIGLTSHNTHIHFEGFFLSPYSGIIGFPLNSYQ